MNPIAKQTSLVRGRPAEVRASDDGQVVRSASAATVKAAEPAPEPAAALRQRIEARAFELYTDRCRNGGCGDEVSDWLAAEQEVRGAAAAASGPAAAGQVEVQVKSRTVREMAGAQGL